MPHGQTQSDKAGSTPRRIESRLKQTKSAFQKEGPQYAISPGKITTPFNKFVALAAQNVSKVLLAHILGTQPLSWPSFLYRTHLQDLKDVTEEAHYENYRAQHIQRQSINNNNLSPTQAKPGLVISTTNGGNEHKVEQLLSEKDAEVSVLSVP